jgi:predicted dehydrogenase
MNLRFHPAILELKGLVDGGELGTVHFAQASFGYDLRLWHPDSDYRSSYSARAELGGGIVLDAIHELDYLRWLLGPVSSVSAEMAHVSDLDIDVEDLAVVALRFESGALGSVDLNFFEPAYRRGCTLVGSNRAAWWDWRSAEITISEEGAPQRAMSVACDVNETYRAELIDFFNASKRGEEPRTPMADGLQSVLVAESIKQAALSGQRVPVGSM